MRVAGEIVGFTDACKARVRVSIGIISCVVTFGIFGVETWYDDAAEWLRSEYPPGTDVWFEPTGGTKAMKANIYLTAEGDDTIADEAYAAEKAV